MQKTRSNVFKYLIAGALAFLLALTIFLTVPAKPANAAAEDPLTTNYENGPSGSTPTNDTNILNLTVPENLAGRNIYINPKEFSNWYPVINDYGCTSYDFYYVEIITSNGKTLKIGPADGSRGESFRSNGSATHTVSRALAKNGIETKHKRIFPKKQKQRSK